MTVKELIDSLKLYDQDSEVHSYIEGSPLSRIVGLEKCYLDDFNNINFPEAVTLQEISLLKKTVLLI